jgi:hypothetical protein
MDFGGKTVAVDFDGVLHSYVSGWNGPLPTDDPVPGAVEFILHLQACNAKVIIFSTRATEAEGLAGIVNWLRKHGFPPVEVTHLKPVAVAYVDDRAVPFRRFTDGRGNWNDCLDAIDDLAHARPHGESSSA